MRENGLVSAYGRKRFKVHPRAVNEAVVPNVVARGFGGRAPRTHICSDLTHVRVGASWNYVCLLVDREAFGTTRELRAKLSDYMHRYDNFRIHSTLDCMSPVEFREGGAVSPGIVQIGVANPIPIFIRACADEYGRCSDEADNQGAFTSKLTQSRTRPNGL